MPLVVGTLDGETPRPMIPVTMRYACPTCGGVTEAGEAIALVDSGTSACYMPAALLPPHVPWASLPKLLSRHNVGLVDDIECRLWAVKLSAYGVPFAHDVRVSAPGYPPKYLILGTNDFFTRFAVTFLWSNTPPVFNVEPIGQLVDVEGTTPALPDLRAAYWSLPGPVRAPELPDGSRDGLQVAFDGPRLLHEGAVDEQA